MKIEFGFYDTSMKYHTYITDGADRFDCIKQIGDYLQSTAIPLKYGRWTTMSVIDED